MGRYYRRRYRLAAQPPRRHRRGRHSGARAEVPAGYHGSAGQMPERSTAAAQDERLPPQSRPESRRDPQPARGHCRRLLRRATARGRPPVAEGALEVGRQQNAAACVRAAEVIRRWGSAGLIFLSWWLGLLLLFLSGSGSCALTTVSCVQSIYNSYSPHKHKVVASFPAPCERLAVAPAAAAGTAGCV